MKIERNKETNIIERLYFTADYNQNQKLFNVFEFSQLQLTNRMLCNFQLILEVNPQYITDLTLSITPVKKNFISFTI